MSLLTNREIEYLRSQAHGHLATVDANGMPHVVPVAFRYNADLDTIDISGPRIGVTKKFRDVLHQKAAAFVIDDRFPSGQPRGLEIRGIVEISPTGGQDIHPGFQSEVIRIRPERVATWGVEAAEVRSSRSVNRPG